MKEYSPKNKMKNKTEKPNHPRVGRVGQTGM
jgi:hypothetical protein